MLHKFKVLTLTYFIHANTFVANFEFDIGVFEELVGCGGQEVAVTGRRLAGNGFIQDIYPKGSQRFRKVYPKKYCLVHTKKKEDIY